MTKSKDMAKIAELIQNLGRATRMLVYNCLEISYYSRGAWSYESVMNMSAAERQIAIDFVTKRLEAAAKSRHPVY